MSIVDSFFAGFIVLFASSAISYAAPNKLTVDLALKQESIGRIMETPDGQQIIFERIGPYDSAPADTYRHGALFVKLALSKIYVADTSNMTVVPLFGQNDDVGYWIGEFSPNGKRLSFFSLHDGTLRAGVYEFEARSVRYFDFIPSYTFSLVRQPIWVSNEELVFIAKPSDREPNVWLDQSSEGARREAFLRERSWRGQEAVSAVGGGRFARVVKNSKEQSLIVVNTQTGVVRRIGSGDYLHLSKSITGRFVAMIIRNSGNVVKFGNSSVVGSRKRQWQLAVYDTQLDTKKVICTSCILARESLSWSKEHDELLFMTQSEETATTVSLLRYDASNERTMTVFDVVTQNERVATTIVNNFNASAAWFEDKVVYRELDENKKRRDWIIVDRDSKQTKLSTDFGEVPKELLALGEGAVFFLQDGDVWKACVNGSLENTTANFAPTIRRLEIRRKPLSPKLDRIRHASLTSVISHDGSSDTVHFLNNTGEIAGSVEIPAATDLVLSALPKSKRIIMQSVEGATKVSVLGAQQGVEPATFVILNEHLAGLESAEAVKLQHATARYDSLTSWLFLPAERSMEIPLPLIVVPYPGKVFSDQSPWAQSPWADYLFETNVHTISTQLFTAAGYAVLIPSIPLEPAPSDPMVDIILPTMSALDEAIEGGYVDSERVGVRGQSYGGYAVLSLLSQSGRFKAGVASAGVSNLTSNYGVFSEFDQLTPDKLNSQALWSEFGQGRMGAPPWMAAWRYVRNSPLFSANDINSPLMLIHGDLDTAVNITQSEEMFTALHRQHKDVIFLRYLGEGHGLANPANIRDMWRRKVDFFEEHLAY